MALEAFADYPLLSIILVLPLLSGILIFLVGKKPEKARITALLLSLIPLVLSLLLFTVASDLDTTRNNLLEEHEWIKQAGISYILGVDGLSIAMVFLTTILTTLAILFSWDVAFRPREFYALLLFMETAVLGVFLSLDYFMFFIFWEVGLLPMYFLIAVWGGPNKKYASLKFFFYTQAASVLVFLGILAMYFNTGSQSFSMEYIATNSQGWTASFQRYLFLLLLIGFGVKMPIVPFHTWLPDAHVEAPTAGSVLLAGVLLKMGAYGLIRIALPTCPDGFDYFVWPMFIIASVSIIYGALLCLAQDDLKKLIAYSSVSHMGVVLLGIACRNEIGLAGAIFMMFAHGVISGAMFMLAGSVKHMFHTRSISKLGGLAKHFPLMAALLLFMFMASLGLPGLIGFVGELTIFIGTFQAFDYYLMIPIMGVFITAAYYIWALQRSIFGPVTEKVHIKGVKDLRWFEIASLSVLAALTIMFGVYPTPLWEIIYSWCEAFSFLGGV